MADVQLDDLRNRGDWLDIVVGQPMTRMHLYPVLGHKRRRIGEALQLGRPGMVLKMRVEPGVQLDDGRFQPHCRLDLPGVRLSEKADANARAGKRVDHRGDRKSVGYGKSVSIRIDPVGGRNIKNKKTK